MSKFQNFFLWEELRSDMAVSRTFKGMPPFNLGFIHSEDERVFIKTSVKYKKQVEILLPKLKADLEDEI